MHTAIDGVLVASSPPIVNDAVEEWGCAREWERRSAGAETRDERRRQRRRCRAGRVGGGGGGGGAGGGRRLPPRERRRHRRVRPEPAGERTSLTSVAFRFNAADVREECDGLGMAFDKACSIRERERAGENPDPVSKKVSVTKFIKGSGPRGGGPSDWGMRHDATTLHVGLEDTRRSASTCRAHIGNIRAKEEGGWIAKMVREGW